MHPNLDALKAFAGGFLAIVSWAGGKIAQSIDTIPDFVKAADTPLIILGLGYGCVHLWRELKATNAARIADRDSYIGIMRQDADKAERSRESLIRATMEQTTEFRALRRSVESTRRDSGQPLLQQDPPEG